METFYALYEKLARGALAGGHEAALREVEKLDFDPHQLDCLLNRSEEHTSELQSRE